MCPEIVRRRAEISSERKTWENNSDKYTIIFVKSGELTNTTFQDLFLYWFHNGIISKYIIRVQKIFKIEIFTFQKIASIECFKMQVGRGGDGGIFFRISLH